MKLNKQLLQDMFQEFYEEGYTEIEGTDDLVRDKNGELVDMVQVKIDFMDFINENI